MTELQLMAAIAMLVWTVTGKDGFSYLKVPTGETYRVTGAKGLDNNHVGLDLGRLATVACGAVGNPHAVPGGMPTTGCGTHHET